MVTLVIKILHEKFPCFRLKIKRGELVITDSGYIYDTHITGGKVGVITYGQGNAVWANLKVKSFDR